MALPPVAEAPKTREQLYIPAAGDCAGTETTTKSSERAHQRLKKDRRMTLIGICIPQDVI
jgi:hypothetical protein